MQFICFVTVRCFQSLRGCDFEYTNFGCTSILEFCAFLPKEEFKVVDVVAIKSQTCLLLPASKDDGEVREIAEGRAVPASVGSNELSRHCR
jgi:hypothetical protein